MKSLLIGTTIVSIILSMIGLQSQASPTQKVANLAKPMEASKHIDSIVLGAGCFWGAEKRYAAISGVIDAVSGYAGGDGVKASYDQITKYRNKNNPNNHAEVVKVTFNQQTTSLESILQNYFEGHDPTQLNGQGNDIGTQYRSIILTNSPEQAKIAKTVLNQYQQLLSNNGYGKIVTIIKPLKAFTPAEDYHQDYLEKNPFGYCPDHSTGVKFDISKTVKKVDNSQLKKGLQIVIIDSANYCPYCEKFKADVVSNYNKKPPISFKKANQLDGLSIQTATWATPTILFLKNGKEIFGHQGYMKPDNFYAAYGKFIK